MSEEAVVTEETAAPEAATEAPAPSAVEEASATIDAEASPKHDAGSELGFLDHLQEQVDNRSSDPAAEENASSSDTPEKSLATEDSGETSDPAADFPDAEALSDVLDDKASAKWGELRSELSEARQRASELEAQMEARSSSSEDDPGVMRSLEDQLHQASQTIEAYEQELAVSRVETSPEYIRTVTEPLHNIMEASNSLAERNNVDPEALIGILTDTSIERQNRALEEVTGEMHERDKMMLFRMVEDAQSIFAYDAELKEHASEAAAELDRNNDVFERQALEQYTLDTRASVNKVYDKFESVLPQLEGTDLAEMREKTLSDSFLDLGVDHQAYAVSAGTMLPPMVKALRVQEAKIAELEGQLASYQKATPAVAPSGGGVQVTPTDAVDADLGFLEVMEKMTR
tara:strand:- start:1030 stop:2235 length:1206 start_codon:yes stop_codon:yes gene_type:complete